MPSYNGAQTDEEYRALRLDIARRRLDAAKSSGFSQQQNRLIRESREFEKKCAAANRAENQAVRRDDRAIVRQMMVVMTTVAAARRHTAVV
ncbi:hypothetical protein ACVBEF_19535 [Glaciimonas sp. GG7]